MSKISTVTILGGGSAGWMTAAALSKSFPVLKITLIESKNIPIIGVGEGSLAAFNQYLKLIEIKDEDWMPSANATYKTSIKFTNFLSESSSYHNILKSLSHPVKHFGSYEFFLISKLYPDVDITEFSKYFDDNHEMTIQNKLTDKNDVFNWNFEYDKAYNMDAYKFGQTLKEKIALPNGVIFIEDDAISAPLNANGEIDYIETANHGKIKSDLYIDCTAFKSFLIGQSLNVPFESFSDVLVNDRAVVANIPYFDKEKELTVWANCTTLKNGWLWNIPTWDRLGTGYVYSSRFVDDETALKEFKEGLRVEYGNRADNIEARYVKFTPGARKKMWHKNVLAIGLSAGFLEPLRSTGLMMTHNNILRVVSLLSTKNCFVNSIDKDMFNRQSKNEILLYKDNVAAHYAFCRRKDSEYWRYVTEEINYVDNSIEFSKLADNLDSNQISFSVRVLTGMGFNPISDFALTQLKESNKINFPLLEKIMRDWKDRKNIIDNYTKNLPSNLEFHKQKIYKD